MKERCLAVQNSQRRLAANADRAGDDQPDDMFVGINLRLALVAVSLALWVAIIGFTKVLIS